MYMHDLNILHRDLHPGNVLLSGGWSPCEWQAQLADFGKACCKPWDRQVVLPLAFRSPELLFAQGACLVEKKNAGLGGFAYQPPLEADNTKSVDIWALACLFKFAYTGSLPFGHSNDGAQLIAALLHKMGAPDHRCTVRAKWTIFHTRAGPKFLQTYGRSRAELVPGLFLNLCEQAVFQWDMETRPSAHSLQSFFCGYCPCLPDVD